jgi:three-Cys-motif partner protein
MGEGDELTLFDQPAPVPRPPRRKFRRAKDASIELREFGGWTLSKLTVLRLYLAMYRRVAGSGTYIDGFAGRGSFTIAANSEEQKGSARIALESKSFRTLHLFELDGESMAALTHNLGYHYTQRQRRGVRLYGADFNERILDLLDREVIPKDRPCFAFLDPDSTQLPWSTVERLARYKEPVDPPTTCKTEQWILFNTHQALGRLVDRQGAVGYEQSGRAATLDVVMGGREVWWPLYEQGAHINQYARRYADRLRDVLGYQFAHAQIIKDPATGSPQYFMIHASDHAAAFDFMRWAKKESCYFDNTEQFPGFDGT